MGRDYWNWSGKRATGGGGGGDVSTSSSCISSIFRFLDFHHFQLCYTMNHLNPQDHRNPVTTTTTSETHASLKGLEAPRNSSESESDPFISENLSIPQMSNIQVKTKRRPQSAAAASSDELSQDNLSSPGSRTPSLVARLMGLDLLPESTSPALSTKLHGHRSRKDVKTSGTQSLPESPRTSQATLSDVDLHHRLSLQVSKENEMSKRREIIKSLVKKCEAEGWSPKHYAKQIVKESLLTRRVGLSDITNTVKNKATEKQQQRRDEHLLASKIRSGDGENQAPTTSSNTQQNIVSSKPARRERIKPFSDKQPVQVEKIMCKKAVEDKFKFTACLPAAPASSSKKKPSKIDQHHHKINPFMSKRTPPATEHHLSLTKASLLAKNKDHPSKRTNLDRIKQECEKRQRTNSQSETHIYVDTKTQTVGGPEVQYITKILKCMGIGNHTRLISITNWHSPSHPLNPSIFQLLEPISNSSSIQKCDRQLIFHLTDEFLADIIRPSACNKVHMMMNGGQLVKVLTSKMASLPLSNCQDLHDVDALVVLDCKTEAVEEYERESVVRELERDVLDCLLSETASFYLSASTPVFK